MPSVSISNDHGKSFTQSLATMETVGTPTFGVSSLNGIYSANPTVLVSLSDTSLLSSSTAGEPSGIVLSGDFINITQGTKETFFYNIPILAVVGNSVFLGGVETMTNMGVTNPSSGDAVEIHFNYTLVGAYTKVLQILSATIS